MAGSPSHPDTDVTTQGPLNFDLLYQKEIEEAVRVIKTTPTDPISALKSRRTPSVGPVLGDALVFLMNDLVLVAILRRFQENLRAIISAHSLKPLERKEDKFWKIQDFFHASFAAHIPPSSAKEYAEKKAALDSETLHSISSMIHSFLNREPYCTIEEFKMNSDGHIVARPNIEPAQVFFQTRAEIIETLKSGSTTVRHAAVEASNSSLKVTLGCVIGLIDLSGLDDTGKERVRISIQCLNDKLKGRRFKLNTIAWLDWHNKRTCSEHAQMMRVEYTKGSMMSHRLPVLLKHGIERALPYYKAPLVSQDRFMEIIEEEKIRYKSLSSGSVFPALLSDSKTSSEKSSLPFYTALPHVQSFLLEVFRNSKIPEPT